MVRPQYPTPESEKSANIMSAEEEKRGYKDLQLRAKSEAEAKLRIAEAKIRQEAQLRAAAEAKAEQESRLRVAAESKAEEESRLRTEAETRALEELKLAQLETKKELEEAQLLVKAHAKDADFARAQVEKAIIARIEEEKLAALEAERARAKEALQQQFKNKLKASESARQEAALQSKTNQEAELLAAYDFKVAQHAELAAIARAKEEQEALLKAQSELQIRELAAKAAELEMLRVAAEIKAAQEERLRVEAEAKLIEAARLNEMAAARAAQENLKLEHQIKHAADVAAKAQINTPAPQSHITQVTQANAADAWFYTSEGNRLGPVTFEQLKVMAARSLLNPRLDMAWKEGMSGWQLAGQIQGLFQTAQIPSAPPHVMMPTQIAVHPATSHHQTRASKKISFTVHNGVGRTHLFVAVLVLPFVWSVLLSVFSDHVEKVVGVMLGEWVLHTATLVPFAVMIYFGLRRLVDLGMNRWWLAGLLAPGLNLWVCYRLFACPSGYAYHKKFDPPGVIIAVTYWLLVLAISVFCAAVIAPFLSSGDSSGSFSPIRSLFSLF